MELSSQPPRARKLGILISARPEQPSFRHGVRLAGTALRSGVDVYLYCIDDGVLGLEDPELQALKTTGLKLYACAYGAQRRNLPINESAMFAGLTIVSDLMANTDRFISFS